VAFELREVGLDFIETAERRYRMEAIVAAPRPRVWQAIADPGTWSAWFPGVGSAWYEGPEPWGVGTRRIADVSGQRFEERILCWDEPERWGYRIERSTLPLARAQIECHELSECPEGTRVRWTLACDPGLPMRLGGPLLARTLQTLHARAMRNLEAWLVAE